MLLAPAGPLCMKDNEDLLTCIGLAHLAPSLAHLELLSPAITRLELLALLKSEGVVNLKDRQSIANASGRMQRGRLSEIVPTIDPILRPGDPRLFLSPFNWVEANGMAVTANPGAYFRAAWRTGGNHSGGRVDLVLDSSAATGPFMTLTYSIDGQQERRICLPHGDARACLSLELDAAPREERTLLVRVENSVQQFDRWGSPTQPLPACSLRLLSVRLPRGAVPLEPRLRKRRLLCFGCSITEGVSAAYQASTKGGDLNWNSASSTWAVQAAELLDAEVGIVGFGRQGWSVGGNGNVPCFHSASEASWQYVYHGATRNFGTSKSDSAATIVLVLHGTNDGLLGVDRLVMVESIAAWLADARRRLGPEAPGRGPGGNAVFHQPADAADPRGRRRS